jgi:hypothetical protein
MNFTKILLTVYAMFLRSYISCVGFEVLTEVVVKSYIPEDKTLLYTQSHALPNFGLRKGT